MILKPHNIKNANDEVENCIIYLYANFILNFLLIIGNYRHREVKSLDSFFWGLNIRLPRLWIFRTLSTFVYIDLGQTS